jgi:hypothetical protein
MWVITHENSAVSLTPEEMKWMSLPIQTLRWSTWSATRWAQVGFWRMRSPSKKARKMA